MGVCEVPVVSSVCHAAGKAASSLVSAPFEWVAEGVGAAAGWMFKGVWRLFESTTLVNLTEPHYLKVYDVLFGVAVFLMLLFFCLQLITGLVHRDPGALRRAAIGLGKSVLGSFLVVSLTGLALEIVDELCVGIIQASGNTLEEMGAKIAALGAGIGAITLASPGAGAVIVIFLGCLAITGAAILWGSLLVRKALLLVAVVLAPVALSGQSWDMARGWFSKWASFVIALIVSKLVVVVIFLVAINQMNAPIDLGVSSIANPVAGIVLMLIAAFAPYIAYKFISFIGIDHHHATSAESEAKQAILNRPAPYAAVSSLGSARKILGGRTGQQDGGEPPGGGRAPSGGGGLPGDPAGGGSQAAGGPPGAAGAMPAAGGATAQAAGEPARSAASPVAAAAKAGTAAGHAVAHSAEQHADAGQNVATPAGSQAPGEPGRTVQAPVTELHNRSLPTEGQRPTQPGHQDGTVASPRTMSTLSDPTGEPGPPPPPARRPASEPPQPVGPEALPLPPGKQGPHAPGPVDPDPAARGSQPPPLAPTPRSPEEP